MDKTALTFDEGVKIALNADKARKDLKILKPSSSSANTITNTVRGARRDDWNKGNFQF